MLGIRGSLRVMLRATLAGMLVFTTFLSQHPAIAWASPEAANEAIEQLSNREGTLDEDISDIAQACASGIVRDFPNISPAEAADECEGCTGHQCSLLLGLEELQDITAALTEVWGLGAAIRFQSSVWEVADRICVIPARLSCEREVERALATNQQAVPLALPGLLPALPGSDIEEMPAWKAGLIAIIATSPQWGPKLAPFLVPLAGPLLKYVAAPIAIAGILIVVGTAIASAADGFLREDGVSTWDKVGEANRGLGYVEGGKRLLVELWTDAKRDLWDSWAKPNQPTTVAPTPVPVESPTPPSVAAGDSVQVSL